MQACRKWAHLYSRQVTVARSSEEGGGQAGGENYGVLVSMINQDFFIIPSLGSFKIANVAAFLRAARRSRRCDLT